MHATEVLEISQSNGLLVYWIQKRSTLDGWGVRQELSSLMEESQSQTYIILSDLLENTLNGFS